MSIITDMHRLTKEKNFLSFYSIWDTQGFENMSQVYFLPFPKIAIHGDVAFEIEYSFQDVLEISLNNSFYFSEKIICNSTNKDPLLFYFNDNYFWQLSGLGNFKNQ